jgi:hypothetical protein
MTGGFDPGEDFYEDDEPVEQVIAAFERGAKFKTAKPLVLVELHGPRELLLTVNTACTNRLGWP